MDSSDTPHKQDVTGSIPLSSTNKTPVQRVFSGSAIASHLLPYSPRGTTAARLARGEGLSRVRRRPVDDHSRPPLRCASRVTNGRLVGVVSISVTCVNASATNLSQIKTSLSCLRFCIVPFLGLALLHPGRGDGRDLCWSLGSFNPFARNSAAYACDWHRQCSRGGGTRWMTLEYLSLAL